MVGDVSRGRLSSPYPGRRRLLRRSVASAYIAQFHSPTDRFGFIRWAATARSGDSGTGGLPDRADDERCHHSLTLRIFQLVAVYGFILGSTQGLEISSTMSAPKFILGVGCTGLIVTTYGIGLVRRLQRPWTRIAVRVVGSWVAATGLMVMALGRNQAPH